MENMNIEALEQVLSDVKGQIKDGLLASDVFDVETGLSLAGYNSNPAACALFAQMTREIEDTLANAGFPGLNNYYLMTLTNGHEVLMINHGRGLVQGMLLDAAKTNLGVVFSVVLPRCLEGVKKARLT